MHKTHEVVYTDEQWLICGRWCIPCDAVLPTIVGLTPNNILTSDVADPINRAMVIVTCDLEEQDDYITDGAGLYSAWRDGNHVCFYARINYHYVVVEESHPEDWGDMQRLVARYFRMVADGETPHVVADIEI
jgi:hypothetical protein